MEKLKVGDKVKFKTHVTAEMFEKFAVDITKIDDTPTITEVVYLFYVGLDDFYQVPADWVEKIEKK